ncbi:hypothetical protein D9M72_143670 [compost metagenome]
MLPFLLVVADERNPIGERGAGGVVLLPGNGPSARDLAQRVLVRAGAIARVLGVGVADAVAGQDAPVKELRLRRGAKREDGQEAEVVLRNLANARVRFRQDAEHLRHRRRAGGQAAVLPGHRDGEEPRALERRDLLVRQRSALVALDGAGAEALRQAGRRGQRLGFAFDPVGGRLARRRARRAVVYGFLHGSLSPWRTRGPLRGMSNQGG